VSDASRQNLKVSREGIVLIKSFEGFRPRAIQRAEGGWTIGYGHTLSAREGASVSEADAELLLRYDLLPVEKSLNDTIPQGLNQHQFDALVSFAFSVGVDRFAGSDVRQRLNAGSPGEAADAMMGWPEPALPETALRRRAAERALFVANPSTPVALSDLLSAPLPPPAVAAPPEESVAETMAVEPAPTDALEVTASVDSRSAAVAALLGEPTARVVQPDRTQEPVETETSPVPSNDNPTVQPAADAAWVASNDTRGAEPAGEPAPDGLTEATTDPEPEAPLGPITSPVADSAALAATRYAPYGAVMVGPLPYLQPAADLIVGETPAPESDDAGSEMAPAVEPLTIDPTPVVYIPADARGVDPAPVAELVLTPPEDAPEPAIERPLWTPEERDAPDGSETNLFGEDLALTQGGSILRNDLEFEPPAKFDWSETGPFIFMGGVGLVSFGASMAAFRRAAEQSGGSELTIIGWVLALIGLACVGVSSINLYRRFGLPGGD